ncbi:MAG: histidine kinase N-terminal domain-containing protein, partial [Paeniglutamicibacter terrestris]
MAIFTDQLRETADFGPGDEDWLHLLVGDWQLVADLAFADLVLWFPVP